MLWLGPINTIIVAFYVKTYHAYILRLGKNKRGISILSCCVSKETENVMRRKKKCRSHGVSKFPTMWHTGFKIDQPFEMTWTFLCNIRPSHVVTQNVLGIYEAKYT